MSTDLPEELRPFPRGTCKACGAEIVWVPTLTKRMPLVPFPPDGSRPNVTIEDGRARTVRPGEGRYLSHFANCPKASQFRSEARGRR